MIDEREVSGVCPTCNKFVADAYSHYHGGSKVEYTPKELDYFEPIRGLSTNQCLQIAVEAIKFTHLVVGPLHDQLAKLAPELFRLCQVAQDVNKAYEDA